MSERKRFLILIIIMVTASVIVAGTSISMLYRTAFNEEKARLVETAQSQARLIEAVSRFDAQYSKDYPGGSKPATLSQLIDAHENYIGFGETGEFTLSEKVGDNIVFLLSHRHYDLDKPKPISLKSNLAEPMRRALSGSSGTVVGLDYRGKMVLAAYEPVEGLNLGIVAKIDMSEIRAPFAKTGVIAGLFTIIVVLIGTSLFIRISNPIIRQLEDRAIELEKINNNLKLEIDQHIQTQKALEDSEEKFSKAFLNSPVVITLTRIEDGLYLDVNESFEKTYGWAREEVIGRTSNDIGLWPDNKCRDEIMQLLSEKESIKDHELTLLTKHGEPLNFLISLDIMEIGGEKCLISAAVDITDRKLAEKALLESEENLSITLNSIGDAVIATDTKGRVIRMNPIAEKLTGWSLSEAEGRSIIEVFNIINEETRKRVESPVEKVIREGIIVGLANHTLLVSKDGSEFPIADSGAPIWKDNGDIVGVVLVFRDVSEKRKADEALRVSEEVMRSVLETSPVGISIYDETGQCFVVNASLAEMIGATKEQSLQQNYNEIESWKNFGLLDKAKSAIKENKRKRHELIGESTFGQLIQLDCYLVPFGSGQLLFMAHDIANQKVAEEKIQASLKEKEALLGEVHHRVKNNMQLIISLLGLQGDKIEDKKYADMFKESRNRIKAMFLIHERLYQTQNFANINFGEHIKSLVDGLFVSHGVDTNKIELNIEIKDILFDLENAIPCGLIINELVSNSLKHAFPQQGEGNISIVLQSINEDELELTISDDGVGIPEDLDIRAAESMGLHIVRILAEQTLEGKMDLDRTEGTHFHFQLKRSKYQPRI